MYFLSCACTTHNINRDMKSENVLLDDEGFVQVSDLGIALVKKSDKPLTQKIGTPGYWAPEVIKKKPYGRTCDWFSFGVMVYELLTGKLVFKDVAEEQGEHPDKMTLEHEPEYPDYMSEDAIDFCKRLLEKNPAKRMGRGGLSELKKHPWFADIDWKKMEKKEIPPPLVPCSDSVNAADAADIGDFDEEEVENVILDEKDQKAYKSWDYQDQQLVQEEVVAMLKAGAEKPPPKPDPPKSGACCIL